MLNTYFYHLVDAKARGQVDLRDVRRKISSSIAYSFPEAINIDVRRGFYAFSLPSSSSHGLTGRLQKLGRVIAGQLPGLCDVALLHYTSDKHQDSNQLFKRVKSKKAIKACEEELL